MSVLDVHNELRFSLLCLSGVRIGLTIIVAY